jgi:hypothetical protein
MPIKDSQLYKDKLVLMYNAMQMNVVIWMDQSSIHATKKNLWETKNHVKKWKLGIKPDEKLVHCVSLWLIYWVPQ